MQNDRRTGSNDNVDYKKCRKVSNTVLAEHNRRYTLRDGDIIFGKTGTIGEPKRLKAWAIITISANVILIQPHDTSDFVFLVLNSEHIQTQVKNLFIQHLNLLLGWKKSGI